MKVHFIGTWKMTLGEGRPVWTFIASILASRLELWSGSSQNPGSAGFLGGPTVPIRCLNLVRETSWAPDRRGAFLSTNEPLCGGDARPREGVLVFPRAEAHLSSLTAGENRTLSRASSVDLSFTRDTQVHWGTGDWSRKGKQGQAFGGFEVKI